MTRQIPADHVSRRAALIGLGAGAVGLTATLGQASTALGQDTPDHPFVGCWLAMVSTAPDVPPVANVSIATADGFIVNMAPVSRVGPNGVTIASGGAGRWESTGERSVHFTTVQVLSNQDGVFLGTLTIDAHPTVNDDGMGFVDDAPDGQATIRDATGAVVSTMPTNRDTNPLLATRVDVGAPGFPDATPATARRTSETLQQLVRPQAF
jgi:hypothetical protein